MRLKGGDRNAVRQLSKNGFVWRFGADFFAGADFVRAIAGDPRSFQSDGRWLYDA
jgi:hypothetical protein